jgi:hypothetical protein
MRAQVGWVEAANWHLVTQRELKDFHRHRAEDASQEVLLLRSGQAVVQEPELGLISHPTSALQVRALEP